ncbi:MAG: hypothetical protein FD123_2196 [Bacteroidetes bacterium]|nr:MAG: hypothetical protein FD123_2196 [Bacteroidota bacterium]
MTTKIINHFTRRLLLGILTLSGSGYLYGQTQACDGCVGANGDMSNCNIVTLSSPSPTPDLSAVSYSDSQFQLVFEEYFNGSSLDLDKWNYGGWIPDDPNYKYTINALPYCGYSGQNVSVSGGNAHITTTYAPAYYYDQDNFPDTTTEYREYRSGQIKTDLLFGTGKFEIRCQIPALNGQWPAFWLYAESDGGFGYNHNQEIDCFEIKQNHDAGVNNCTIGNGCDSYFDPYQASKRMIMTSHFKEEDVPYGQQCSPQMCFATNPLVDGFHTYTVIWDLNKIQWYLDGNLINTVSRFVYAGGANYTQNKDFPSPHVPMRIIIGNSVWANYTANLYDEVNNTAQCGAPNMPSDFIIDYVKVWKRDCNTTLNLCYDSSPLYVVDYSAGTINTSETCSEWVVNSGQKQRFTAHNEISFKNFHAVAGSKMHASIIECDGQLPRMLDEEKLAQAVQVASVQQDISQPDPGTTSTPEQMNHDIFSIIPNPSSGQFSVVFDSNEQKQKQLQIHDLTGRLVFNSIINASGGTNKIDFAPENLGPGVYFLRIEGISGAQPLVIQKQ